jgi:hypothetical protein
MNRLKLFTVGAGLLAYGQTVQAQSISPSVLNASGGSQSAGAATFEWSVGEMTLVSTASAGSIVVTQGLLQPLQAPAAIGNVVISTEDLSVFPVPASSILNIKPGFRKPGTMVLLLVDATGKTVLHSEVLLKTGTELQQLNISSFANGNYLLSVSYEASGTLSHQSYKIQKIN